MAPLLGVDRLPDRVGGFSSGDFSGLGLRKFAAYFATLVTLVGLLTTGYISSQNFVDAVSVLVGAFFAGNAFEHLAGARGPRRDRPYRHDP